ncbi:hypothetical protein CCH79_00020435, partial [Gambusia affinis]
MWLVSSAAWAKGLSDVKTATDPDEVITLIDACEKKENSCREVHDPVMSGLNTSVPTNQSRASFSCSTQQTAVTCCVPLQAFGFINLVLWAGNLWFVFKETGIIAPFMRAPPPEGKPAADAYAQQGAYEQDPYASNQGAYQPEFNQQGYNQVTTNTEPEPEVVPVPSQNQHQEVEHQIDSPERPLSREAMRTISAPHRHEELTHFGDTIPVSTRLMDPIPSKK